MKISLIYRLITAILSATGIAILSLFLIMQWSLNRGFYQYLGKMEQEKQEQVLSSLGKMYSLRKSWDFLKTTPALWDFGNVKSPPEHAESSAVFRRREA